MHAEINDPTGKRSVRRFQRENAFGVKLFFLNAVISVRKNPPQSDEVLGTRKKEFS
jgi:hypothetical protein